MSHIAFRDSSCCVGQLDLQCPSPSRKNSVSRWLQKSAARKDDSRKDEAEGPVHSTFHYKAACGVRALLLSAGGVATASRTAGWMWGYAAGASWMWGYAADVSWDVGVCGWCKLGCGGTWLVQAGCVGMRLVEAGMVLTLRSSRHSAPIGGCCSGQCRWDHW